MTKSAEIVGQNIQKLRKSLKLSQQDMAERAGISYKYLGEIERGKVNLSVDILMKISNSLQIQPEKLLASQSKTNDSQLKAQAILADLSPQQLEIIMDMVDVLKKHSTQ
ncbi:MULTISPECIES: helix-turn-helix domain-containing protein [unclassified Maridesulfovibrio]|uniref:helix-turn-helix domain-containing protein n=1 Tax=unclassified Maridesulfovibrio TaxID=2794999 RepID=UPI003B3F0160